MDEVESGGAAGAETSDIGAAAAGRKRDAVLRLLQREPLADGAKRIDIAIPMFGYKNHVGTHGAGDPHHRAREGDGEDRAREPRLQHAPHGLALRRPPA